MYVPGLPLGVGSDIGHKHFQHPQRTTRHYGPAMDRFSFIVIDLSLMALIEDCSLHQRFREGGEAIISLRPMILLTRSAAKYSEF
jgi:hypothetical protein